jgi:hypothetical protein
LLNINWGWTSLLGWNLAIQGGQSRSPFNLITGSASAEIDAQGAKFGGTARLGCAAKNVGLPGDLELHKAGHHHSQF